MRLASAVFPALIQYPKRKERKEIKRLATVSFVSATMQMNGEMNAKKATDPKRNHLTFKFDKFCTSPLFLYIPCSSILLVIGANFK